MRRKDREVTDIGEIESMMQRCAICRLALHGGEYPYIVPMSFGYIREKDGFALYFHCAREGTKLDLLRQNPRAAFEMDSQTRVIPGRSAGEYTMAYESVVGHGMVAEVHGEEKRQGLAAIMRQVVPEKTFALDDAALSAVCVLRLDVLSITGKRNQP